jgi:hypothetical protein
MDARSGGVLAALETPAGELCVGLMDGQKLRPMIWPAGFFARLDPLELLDVDVDAVVAHGGQYLVVFGGYLPPRPSTTSQSGAFYIQSYEVSEAPGSPAAI